MYLAVGSRGRGMRRQGTRCEGYREAMLSAPWTARSPAPGYGHTHKGRSHARSIAKHRLAGGDQPLDGLDLIKLGNPECP